MSGSFLNHVVTVKVVALWKPKSQSEIIKPIVFDLFPVSKQSNFAMEKTGDKCTNLKIFMCMLYICDMCMF